MVGGSEGKKRSTYLLCPSLTTRIVQITVWEDEKLDLGSIARVFELDPTSLKLNGHFIARGVDFIASSVTWRSLVSFFSARGLSTGTTASDPIVVDGKLSKLGSKRMYDPEDCNADYSLIKSDSYPNKKPFFHVNATSTSTSSSCCKKRSRARDSGLYDEMNEPMKKLKLNLASSGNEDTKEDRTSGITVSSGEYSWGFNQNMKRNRQDNLDLANTHKKTRV